MEAVPRLPMICFPNRTSLDTPEFAEHLKRYIRNHYNEDPESYNNEIYELESLRRSAINAQTDFVGCSTLKKYYCQLHNLTSRFPFDESGVKVFFTWTSAFDQNSSQSGDISYELDSIMYNIGALHTSLGALDSRTTSDGMKISCTHFQCSAWAFQVLSQNSRGESELNSLFMNFMMHLSLSQAQECILEKSMTDNRKANIIAKLSMQVVEYLKITLKNLESFKKSNGPAVDLVGSKLIKMWQRHCEFKIAYYHAVTYFHQGLQSEEQQKMGERLAYYQGAVEKLEEAVKLAKNLDQTKLINEAVAFANDVIRGKLTAGQKENEFVYHEKIPSLASLPEVKGASLVKGISFSFTDPDVAGPDIFSKLVPMEAHQASSLYSEEKAKLLRRIGGELTEKNDEVETYLASMQLDGLTFNDNLDALPQELVDCCADLNSRDALKEMTVIMSDINNVYHDVKSKINDILSLIQEEEAQGKEFAIAMKSKEGPNQILSELRREGLKYKEAHEAAHNSNKSLHAAITLHKDNIVLLSGPLSQLVEALPSAAGIEMEGDRLTRLEIQRLLNKVVEMQKQRMDFEDQFRKKLQDDDVTKQLVTTTEDIQEFFKHQLSKHDHIVKVLEQNMAAQTNILQALSEANAAYASTRYQINKVKGERNDIISSLLGSYNTFLGIKLKARDADEFYRKLEGQVNKLHSRVKSLCKVKEEEREGKLSANVRKFVGGKFETGEKMASHNFTGPKLKDYLNADKEFKDLKCTTGEMIAPYGYIFPSGISQTAVDAGTNGNTPSYGSGPMRAYGSETSTQYPYREQVYYQPSTPTSYSHNLSYPGAYVTSGSSINVMPSHVDVKGLPSAHQVNPSVPSTSPSFQNYITQPNYSVASTSGLGNTGSLQFNSSYPSASSLLSYGYSNVSQQYSSASIVSPTPQASTPATQSGLANYYKNYYATAPQQSSVISTSTYSGSYHPHTGSQEPTQFANYQVFPSISSSATASSTSYANGISSGIAYNSISSPSSHSTNPPQVMHSHGQVTTNLTSPAYQPGYSLFSAATSTNSGSAVYNSLDYSNPYAAQNTIATTGCYQSSSFTDSAFYTASQGPYPATANQRTSAVTVVSSSQPGVMSAHISTSYPGSNAFSAADGTSVYSSPSQSGTQNNSPLTMSYSAAQVPQAYSFPSQNATFPHNPGNNTYFSSSQGYATNVLQPTHSQAIVSQSASVQPSYSQPSELSPTRLLNPKVSKEGVSNLDLLSGIELTPSSNQYHSINAAMSNPYSTLSVAPDVTSDGENVTKTTAVINSTNNSWKSQPTSGDSASVLDLTKFAKYSVSIVDPLSDDAILNQLASETEKLSKFVVGLDRKSLNGPTNLEIKWKEFTDILEVKCSTLKVSVGRCYPMNNRFPDNLPFDFNRVQLPSPRDDYINASYVKLKSIEESIPMILTQYPLPNTVTDFWTMVWDKQVEVIVCLNAEVEVKGQKYFPKEMSQDLECGNFKISVKLNRSMHNGCWIQLTLQLCHTILKASRVVIFIQFLIWPPSTLPDNPGPFLQFITEAHSLQKQQRNKLNPLVVNCISGTGRSGVFAVLSSFMKHLHATGALADIWNLVIELCQQRRSGIQDRWHLLLLYSAALYHVQEVLMKRGILTDKATFEDGPREKKHVRHPSADLLSSDLNRIKAKLGFENEVSSQNLSRSSSQSSVISSASSGGILVQESNIRNESSYTSVATTPSPTHSVKSEGRPAKIGSITLPPNLAASLDPDLLDLTTAKPSKGRKITKASFFSPSTGLCNEKDDDCDPLSGLDPLWNLKN